MNNLRELCQELVRHLDDGTLTMDILYKLCKAMKDELEIKEPKITCQQHYPG